MPVQVIPVETRRDLKRFIYLPAELHRDHPKWLPPIYMDEWKYYDPKKNLAFRYSDATLVLAEKDGRLVGRAMGIVNRRHNQMMQERTARFACLESTDDREVCHALLAHVEGWARERGMTNLVGRRSVAYWDSSLNSQLHQQNRCWSSDRVTGDSP